MKRLFALLLPLILIATPSFAQQVGPLSVNLSEDILNPQRLFQIISLVTVLSLAPSILMVATSFTRIIIVFAFLRSAIGLQTTPPNSVLVSLALFLTFFIMAPTLQQSYQGGLVPYFNGQIDETQAFNRTTAPFQRFMAANVNEGDLKLFIDMLPEGSQPPASVTKPGQTPEVQLPPLQALIPAFILSEIRRAFEIGFLIFLPFLVIDLTVASILMSMGMMMLPPVTIALPFKIIFFVLVNGWHLLAQTLVESFNIPT